MRIEWGEIDKKVERVMKGTGGITGTGCGEPIVGMRPDAPTDGKQTITNYCFDLIPAESLFRVAQRMQHGKEKGYARDGWRSISVEQQLNHAIGHIYAYLLGNTEDDHLAGAACRVLFAIAVGSAPPPPTPSPTCRYVCDCMGGRGGCTMVEDNCSSFHNRRMMELQEEERRRVNKRTLGEDVNKEVGHGPDRT